MLADKANPDAGDLDRAFVRLVDSGFLTLNPYSLDATRAHFARWIARQRHDVSRSWPGRYAPVRDLHPGRGNHAFECIPSDVNADIRPELRLLWTILSNHEPKDPQGFLWSLKQSPGSVLG